MMPVHCDSSGNLFLQPPLSKIVPDGRRAAIFDSSAARQDGFTDLVTKSFAVDQDGSVYQLARTADQRVVILRFNRDGHYQGAIVLAEAFEPEHLATFNGRTFLVSGVTLIRTGRNPQFSAYVAVVDWAGRLVQRVDTKEPVYTPAAGREGGETAEVNAPKDEHGAGNTAQTSAPFELGILESDGTYAYVLRQGVKPTVFVISAAGTIDRTLALSPPPYPNIEVSALRVGPSQLLVEYVRPKALPNGNAAYYLVVYDLANGSKVSEYTRGRGISGTLGCTDWKGNFSFLSADESGRPALLNATVR
jgi:hypothetical protein